METYFSSVTVCFAGAVFFFVFFLNLIICIFLSQQFGKALKIWETLDGNIPIVTLYESFNGFSKVMLAAICHSGNGWCESNTSAMLQ